MRFGLALPNCREGLYYPPDFISESGIIELGHLAEQLGYDSLWVNDHITPPEYAKALYHGSPNFYDPIVTLATVAQHTEKILLGYGVAVLPIRDPVILAKQVMTLDSFSDGRVMLGVGLGSYKEEYQALGRDIHNRLTLFNEGIESLRILLDNEIATYQGSLIRFKGLELKPRGKQKCIPLYIAGNSRASLRKIAKWANGWMPAALSPAQLLEFRSVLKRICEEIKKDPSDIDIAPQLCVCMDRSSDRARAKFLKSGIYRHLQSLSDSTMRSFGTSQLEERDLIGTPSEIIERISKYQEIGITHLPAIIFTDEDAKELVENIKLFSKEVMNSF